MYVDRIPPACRARRDAAERLDSAASISVLLINDRVGRIADETLTDPSHLVTQRDVYPDHD
jgi:hypothetical protein